MEATVKCKRCISVMSAVLLFGAICKLLLKKKKTTHTSHPLYDCCVGHDQLSSSSSQYKFDATRKERDRERRRAHLASRLFDI